MLKREVAGEYPVIGAAIAPFSLPSMLMGTEKFMSLLLDDENIRKKYFSKLMKEMINYTVKWSNMQAESRSRCNRFSRWYGFNTVITRKLFETYALPIVVETINKLSYQLFMNLSAVACTLLI
ncbi:hypothetical protein KHA80_15200 [Anaerobacillus sp. HL2]|nr:hypothetical protein KHA80_15200 [Anaerobacillus sp. HL2]